MSAIAYTKDEREAMDRKTGKSEFVIDLREYEQLASEYICEKFPPELQLSEQLRLSDFVVWLRKRTEADRQRERQSVARTTTKGE